MRYKPHHTAITASDIARSIEFYGTFGFNEVFRYAEPDGSMTIVHLRLDSYVLELFWYRIIYLRGPLNLEYAGDLKEIGMDHVAVSVDDIDEALNDLRQKGIANQSTVIDKSSTGKASWFFVKDPDGMWVEIIWEDRY